MAKDGRRLALLELLADVEMLSVEEAADKLDVSAATIRRDFDDLAAQRMLVRTRGGAVASTVTYELPLRYKSATRPDEKRRIGVAAAELIARHAVVGINGGTTTSAVARALAERATTLGDGSDGAAVTVVTNAVNVAHELLVRPEVKVVLTGGVARSRSYELIGPLATLVLGQLFLDVTVLGVNGITADGGASADNEGEAEINALLVEHAQSVIVVADSTKLGRRAFSKICGIDRVTTLVTDANVTDETAQSFEAQGVTVIRA